MLETLPAQIQPTTPEDVSRARYHGLPSALRFVHQIAPVPSRLL
ncbi:hypothetical protein OG474_23070 [Kribbella sp. NBC_01505]